MAPQQPGSKWSLVLLQMELIRNQRSSNTYEQWRPFVVDIGNRVLRPQASSEIENGELFIFQPTKMSGKHRELWQRDHGGSSTDNKFYEFLAFLPERQRIAPINDKYVCFLCRLIVVFFSRDVNFLLEVIRVTAHIVYAASNTFFVPQISRASTKPASVVVASHSNYSVNQPPGIDISTDDHTYTNWNRDAGSERNEQTEEQRSRCNQLHRAVQRSAMQ